jgi:peptidyl-prolyl cis-trans isomerase C
MEKGSRTMFNILKSKTSMMVLPAAAVLMLTGCEEEEMANAPESAPVDLTQTEDLFSAPVKPNPLTTDPDAVVVRVNGEDITRGEINDMMAMAMQRFGGQIPPEQLQAVQSQMIAQIKEELINQKLLGAAVIAENIQVDDAEVAATIEEIRASLPEDQTLEAALEREGQTLEMLQEKIKTDMATRQLMENKTADVPEATEAEAREFYDSNPDQFAAPENVSASHILITFDDTDTDETKAEKKAKLEEIRQSIIAETVSFEDAASENSDCPSSAQGGSLGTFGKGRMVPAFEVAAFSQEIGEIGEIIETQFGYHIIKVSDHKEEGTVAFEDTKDQLINYLTNQKKQQAVLDYIASLRDSATIEEM